MSLIIYNLNGTGTEIPAINIGANTSLIVIQGVATATGNYAISYTGTPNVTAQVNISYRGSLDITTNSTTFSILGQSFNQNDLNRELEITARWTGSAWKVITKKDFKEVGIIEASHLSSNSVTTFAIEDGAVTEPKLATNSVSTIKIQDGAVTKDKINADIAGLGLSQAVGGELDVNVDNSTLEINSDTLRIKNDGVTTVKILDQNVTTSKINDLAVTTAKINDGAVTTVKVLDNNITNAKLAQMPALTVKANITGGTANAADVAISSLFSNDTTKWSLTGNAGTTPGTNFIGTTDAQDLVFKVNNVESGRLSNSNVAANVSFGKNSLTSITSGTDNASFGHDALINNTSGVGNTAFGRAALSGITSGNNNTSVGFIAGDTLVNGASNVCIGYNADVSSASSSNRIAIGRDALATADNQFAIPTNVTHLNFALNSHGTGATLISDGAGIATWATTTINTTAGDSATINSVAGRFRKDASGTTFTLTNSYITANSIILLTNTTAGITTGNQLSVVAGSGSAVITFETDGVAAAPNANMDINFWVIN